MRKRKKKKQVLGLASRDHTLTQLLCELKIYYCDFSCKNLVHVVCQLTIKTLFVLFLSHLLFSLLPNVNSSFSSPTNCNKDGSKHVPTVHKQADIALIEAMTNHANSNSVACRKLTAMMHTLKKK